MSETTDDFKVEDDGTEMTMHLTDEQYEVIEKRAAAEGMSVEELTNRLIAESLKRLEDGTLVIEDHPEHGLRIVDSKPA